MKKRKILFIQPTVYDTKGNLVKKHRLYFVGLAMPLLAALTPDKYEKEIILETVEDVDFDTDADIIAIGSMGHGVIRTIHIAEEFKKREKTVILGGYMVSLMPDEAEKYCDAVVVGDAEDVWADMLKDYENGVLKKRYEKKISKLAPPLPQYELLLNKKIGDFLPVQAGRGCPNTCSFCSVACLYKSRYYRRPIESVLRDVRRVKELGFKKILLLDDNILSDRKYTLELCKELEKLKISWTTQCSIQLGNDDELLEAVAKSGCTAVSFGLESITKESLNSMNKSWANPSEYPRLIKKIQDAGIDVSTEMVVGADGDTVDSIRNTVKFIQDNKIVVPRFYILTPIPGTKFYNDIVKEGRLINTDIYSYNGTEAVHEPKKMTSQELTDVYWELYNELFSYKHILQRTILRKELFKKPLDFLTYFYVNLYYRYHIKNKITPNII